MTRDYAKKPKKNSRKAKKQGVPGWIWLITGLLLGALLSLLVQLSSVSDEDVEKAAAKTATDESANASDNKNQHKPRFDFYTLLRESEVIVPDGPDTERTIRESSSDTVFLLQAGSFKNAGDADSLRASLLLINLTANIETFKSGSGETWHRVLVGPFANSSQVASARGKLAGNGIESLLLKRKK